MKRILATSLLAAAMCVTGRAESQVVAGPPTPIGPHASYMMPAPPVVAYVAPVQSVRINRHRARVKYGHPMIAAVAPVYGYPTAYPPMGYAGPVAGVPTGPFGPIQVVSHTAPLPVAGPLPATGPLAATGQLPVTGVPVSPDPMLVAPPLPAPTVSPVYGGMAAPEYSTFKAPATAISGKESRSAVRIAVTAPLLQAVFAKASTQFGPVNDIVLGATVTGQQVTQSQTRLELVPDSNQASFQLVLNGVTQADTIGVKSIAGVISTTNSHFEMRKPLSFDGRWITTSTPGAVVWTDQQNRAAVPLRGGNVPILRRIIGNQAMLQAERMKPASQQITAQRVSDDAAGRFNARVDQALEKLQDDWSTKVVAKVSEYLPNLDLPTARTTESHAVFSLPSPWANADSSTLIPEWVSFGDGASIAIHESALQAGIERLSLGGFVVGPGDWDRAVRDFASSIVDGTPPEFGSQTGSLKLVDDEPARVEFRDRQLFVILTAKITTPLGDLPAQRITMPWSFSANNLEVFATPGTPTVEAATDEESPLMSVVRPFIVSQLQTELLPLKFPRSIAQAVGEGENMKFATVRLANLRSRDGWLIIGWDVDVDEPRMGL